MLSCGIPLSTWQCGTMCGTASMDAGQHAASLELDIERL